MSAGTAPDSTSVISFNRGLSAVAAIRAILLTDIVVRLAPEHWLVKAMGHTTWMVKFDARSWYSSQRFYDRAVEIAGSEADRLEEEVRHCGSNRQRIILWHPLSFSRAVFACASPCPPPTPSRVRNPRVSAH